MELGLHCQCLSARQTPGRSKYSLYGGFTGNLNLSYPFSGDGQATSPVQITRCITSTVIFTILVSQPLCLLTS